MTGIAGVVNLHASVRTVALSNAVGVLSPADFSHAQDFLSDPGGPIALPIQYGELGESPSLAGPMSGEAIEEVARSVAESRRMYEIWQTPELRREYQQKRLLERERKAERKRERERQRKRQRELEQELQRRLERERKEARVSAEFSLVAEALEAMGVTEVSLTVNLLSGRTGPVWRYGLVDLANDKEYWWTLRDELGARNYYYELNGPLGAWVYEYSQQSKEALIMQMLQALTNGRRD